MEEWNELLILQFLLLGESHAPVEGAADPVDQVGDADDEEEGARHETIGPEVAHGMFGVGEHLLPVVDDDRVSEHLLVGEEPSSVAAVENGRSKHKLQGARVQLLAVHGWALVAVSHHEALCQVQTDQ